MDRRLAQFGVLLAAGLTVRRLVALEDTQCSEAHGCRDIHDAIQQDSEGHTHLSLLQDSSGFRYPGDLSRWDGQRITGMQPGISEAPTYAQDLRYEPPALAQETTWQGIGGVSQLAPQQGDAMQRGDAARAMEQDLEAAAEEVQLAWSQLQTANAHAKLAVANAEGFYALNRGPSRPNPQFSSLQVGAARTLRRRLDRADPVEETAITDAGAKSGKCGGAEEVPCGTFNRILTWDYRFGEMWGIASWVALGGAFLVLTGIVHCIAGLARSSTFALIAVGLLGLLMYGICHDWLDNSQFDSMAGNLQGQLNNAAGNMQGQFNNAVSNMPDMDQLQGSLQGSIDKLQESAQAAQQNAQEAISNQMQSS